MKQIFGLIIALIIQIDISTASQQVKFNKNDLTIMECLDAIKKQTGYQIIYLNKSIDLTHSVQLNLDQYSIENILDSIFNGKDIGYKIKNRTIGLFKKEPTKPVHYPIQIIVKNENGMPVMGASVFADNDKKALGQTDSKGCFGYDFPNGCKQITIKHVNYNDITTAINNRRIIEVILLEKENKLEEAVITGIYTREKESFTGSSNTYTAKDLKAVSNVNLLQALRTLDPSFSMDENVLNGSDPNALPDVNIRGKTSVINLRQRFSGDPNQPLFILDGFESSLSAIFDLSMDRVESITILKDAAATAIYGSKAANGVIVIETLKPKMGELRLTYSNSSNYSFADLKDYNLMNAEEKVLFEKLSGHYGPLDEHEMIIDEAQAKKYNVRLAEVKRGVDSYWMDEPLRKAISSRHNLFAEGGDRKIRYGLGFNYGNTMGVMKGSNRRIVSGRVRLIYRLKKLNFSNNFTVDHTQSENNVVSFSEFSRMNPYYRKYDEYGQILKIVETFSEGISGKVNRYNPMYDFNRKSFDRNNNVEFRNNFDMDWRMIDEVRVRGRFSFAKGISKSQVFISPLATSFDGSNAINKGRFTEANGGNSSFDFDLSSTYGKSLGTDQQHMINAIVGMRANQNINERVSFAVSGYKDEEYWAPKFSNGYVSGSRPNYTFNDRRSLSFYSNAGYSFNNRYLFDFNYRMDGSSLFGVSNKFTKTWAFGIAWNLHQEPWFQGVNKYISYFKLRSSIGNPGNQNFDAYMSMNIYTYNLNYPNPFGLSALISTFGNPHLKWQKTLDKNFGLDLEIFDRKLFFNSDFFYKITDPLLIYIQVPPSTGSSEIAENIGAQKTTGITSTLIFRAIQNDHFQWNLNINYRKMNSTYYKIGNVLDNLNEENVSKNLQRYYDGASTTDLWAVQSLGIDPATGREIFLKKDGTQTFIHDYKDEKVLGNSTPKAEGVIGTMINYKGWSFSGNFRYRYGGQLFLNTLYSKVENISSESLRNNQDRRALYDRWKNVGDISSFKAISLSSSTPISSRFLADENTFSCESISLGYESLGDWHRKLGLNSFQGRIYLNEIFRISTVKNERGINYPFARTVSFSISGRF